MYSIQRQQNSFIQKILVTFGMAFCLFLLVPLLVQAHQLHAEYDHSDPPANARLPSGHSPTHLAYHLAINPGKVGSNTFEVALMGKDGQSARYVNNVEAYFVMEDMNMGIEVLNFTPIKNTPGYYRATASVLSMSGHWEIDLIIRRTGFDDAKVVLHYMIGS